MNMSWVGADDVPKILNLIKGFRVTTLLLFVEGDNPRKHQRYGWVEANKKTDWEDVHELKNMNGLTTNLVRLPGHGVADASTIFIRKDKPEHPGWEKLLTAINKMNDGEIIQHYVYVPCAGTLVNVKKVGNYFKTWPDYEPEPSTISELSLCDVFAPIANGYAVADYLLPIIREYFMKNSQKERGSAYCCDDYYFKLLQSAGIFIAIEVARKDGDTEMEDLLQSWVDAGMTDEESRQVWHNSEKSSCYNRTYYWNKKRVCYETYGLNSPRHKVMCFATEK